MLQANVSPLQLLKLRNLPTGLTEQNHLSNYYLTEPERMDSVLAYAFGTQNEDVLTLITGGLGNTKFITNRQYRWSLHGQNERAIEVTLDSPEASFPQPGIAATTIQIPFGEKFFSVTDVLRADDGTQVRVMMEPWQDGLNYIYTVQLDNGGDLTGFIDPSQISKGARFSKLYSTVEEYSIKGGGTNFSAPMELENQVSILRKKYEVTRSAATDVMVIKLFSEDGKETTMWTKLAEWTSMAQWWKEKDRHMIYSIHSGINKEATLQGENKRPVYTGAGIRQQISPANIYYYNKLTYEYLDSILLDLSYNASRWGGDHKFLALTGKMGMREFSNAITDKFKTLGLTITNEGRFITGSGNELVFAGDQFVTANFPNGVSLTVKEFSPYDDPVQNRQLHPKTGKPVESYRFTILNVGTGGKSGKTNLRKVVKKDSGDVMWYVGGSIDPMGNTAKSINALRSSGIDGYEVHFLTEEGVMLEDPTSCAEILFSSAL